MYTLTVSGIAGPFTEYLNGRIADLLFIEEGSRCTIEVLNDLNERMLITTTIVTYIENIDRDIRVVTKDAEYYFTRIEGI